jgi:hypothetical protein
MDWKEKLGKRKRKTYKTEEERQEARRETWRRASKKHYDKQKEGKKCLNG